MSIPVDHPYVETGDQLDTLEGWRFAGYGPHNTDRGRLYPSTTVGGGLVTVSVYRDKPRTLKVAEGSGAAGTRVSLAALNASGLTDSSVYVRQADATSAIVLWLALASDDDWRARDELVSNLRLDGEQDFAYLWPDLMRQFYMLLQADYPPPSFAGDDLSFPGSSRLAPQGRRGQANVYGPDLWRLNADKDWELDGLQNPADWREWAINYGLAMIWRRRARSGDDPVMTTAADYERRAREAWKLVPVLADTDRDRTPERQVRVSSLRMKRG